MPKMIFVNLPVADLAAATGLYTAIGCTLNPQFSDGNASCMVWSDGIFFMLLTHGHYRQFTAKAIIDAHATSGVLIALTCDSRAAVDAMVAAAVSAGGKGDPRPPMDMGFMYSRAFDDADGHTVEAVWMDPAAVQGGG